MKINEMIDSLKHLVNEAIEASESSNLRDIEKARMLDKAISNCYNQIKSKQKVDEDSAVMNAKATVWAISCCFVFPIGIFVGYFWFGC